MPSLAYRVLDVFTDQPLAGNPLGLFESAAGLDGAQMQAIARELNLSETLFITGRSGDEFSVRIFTPGMEVPFAGHPSIGCAWHLLESGQADGALSLSMPGGLVEARREAGYSPALVSIAPPPVTLGETLEDAELVARLYGVEPGDLALDAGPAQVASVGLRYLQTPLRSRSALERCSPDVELLRAMDGRFGFNQLACFALEPYTADARASVRMFAPLHGVYEDPATGSNAACLAAYLRAHGIIEDSGTGWVKLDQGYSLSRPSALYVQANAAGREIGVRIAGQCVEVAAGTLSF